MFEKHTANNNSLLYKLYVKQKKNFNKTLKMPAKDQVKRCVLVFIYKHYQNSVNATC